MSKRRQSPTLGPPRRPCQSSAPIGPAQTERRSGGRGKATRTVSANSEIRPGSKQEYNEEPRTERV